MLRKSKEPSAQVPANRDVAEPPQPMIAARTDTGQPAGDAPKPRRRLRPSVMQGLSGKLLVLTVLFVMIAEVLIFVPSVANFQDVWLQNRLDTAETASIVYLDEDEIMLSEEAQADLLKATQALQVSIREGEVSILMATSPVPKMVDEVINLAEIHPLTALQSALSTLFFGGDKVYTVSAPMKSRDAQIVLIQEDKHLRARLLNYARNILFISLAISLITAGLVFLTLYWMIVRPITRIASNMDDFSRHPENAALIYSPTGRSDEIGVAEDRLSTLQSDLQATLRQKQHLAELGLAVSKINHDLRNILASAYLFSDRLADVSDPTVQKLAPKLVRTIDRAVEYTHSVLAYGKAVESAPKLKEQPLRAIVDEVGETLAASKSEKVTWNNAVPDDLIVCCDNEHLFRVLLNLSRNALQAIEDSPQRITGHAITIAAQSADDGVLVEVRDTGPGIPDPLKERLFTAFSGTSKAGGTGLGLAIAAELVRGHGGRIELLETGPQGSAFSIFLPSHARETAA